MKTSSIFILLISLFGQYLSPILLNQVPVSYRSAAAHRQINLDAVQATLPQLHEPSPLASQFAALTEISGAVYNEDKGYITLIGDVKEGLPPLELDDFITALRIIYLGESPAVSIDPVPDENQVMKVTYFGEIEDTHLGWVLFEADRILKIYSMGADNQTREPVVSKVPGYLSELGLSAPVQSGADADPIWHRIWLEPAADEAGSVQISHDRRAILFGQAKMIVKTEYIADENNPDQDKKGSDPAAEKFVAHFNANYEKFAQEQKVLYHLAMIQRYLIIARWLKDERIPIDQAWLEYPVAKVKTDAETPRIEASQVVGNIIYYLEGGVDLSRDNEYEIDSPAADELEKTVAGAPQPGGLPADEIKIGPVVRKTALFPIQPMIIRDAAGNDWAYDSLFRRPVYFKNAKSQVPVNINYNVEGGISKMTFAVPGNELEFVYEKGRLVNLRLPSGGREEDREILIEAMDQLVAAMGDYFENQYQLGVTKISERPEDGQPYAHLLSKAAFGDLLPSAYKRLAVINMAHHQVNALTMDMEDGVLVIQRGFERKTFAGVDLQDILLPEKLADFAEAFEFSFKRTDKNFVIVPRYPTGADQAWYTVQVTNALVDEARRRGIQLVHRDDDPALALRNLLNHKPVMDSLGKWNLALVIDEESFGEDQADAIAKIKAAASQEGIPVCSGFSGQGDSENEECGAANLIYLTGRAGSQIVPPLPGGSGASPLGQAAAAGSLEGRYLILLVIDQESERNYPRGYVVDYGATGVAANPGRVSLETASVVIEQIPRAVRSTQQPITAYQAYLMAIDSLLASPDLAPENRSELEYFKENSESHISMRPDEISAERRKS